MGLLAVISGFNTFSAPIDANQPAQTIPDTPAAAVQIPEEVRSPSSRQSIKQKVAEYFADIPIMIDIAECESHFRQVDKNGNVFRGEKNRNDVGVMQINEFYHLDKSRSLGFDLHTLEGNLAFARYLYEKEGARPWLSSSACWAKYTSIARS